jgi:hypothetical protein
MTTLEAQLGQLPDENGSRQVTTTSCDDDNSFNDYVANMSGSVQFDESDDPAMKQEEEEDEQVVVTVPTEPEGAHIREEHWIPKRSFLAESPYFNAFVEKEMHEIGIVTDILNDISNQTRNFTKHGSLMADATFRLSLSCRLRREEAAQEELKLSGKQMDIEMERRRHALGPEITDLLAVLGEVS